MNKPLKNVKVALVATDGFEEVELTEPLKALKQAGVEATVVAPAGHKIKAWNQTDWSIEVPVDLLLKDASAEDFDALVIPGGVLNPDKLRMEQQALTFVKDFFKADKPVFAICHGPQLLIEADLVEGRTLTSWPGIKTDLVNAGATWVDKEVVVDGQLVTSRKPDDLPAFNEKMLSVLETVKA